MGQVAVLGYNKESSPAGERAVALKHANYTQEFPIFGGFDRYIVLRHF